MKRILVALLTLLAGACVSQPEPATPADAMRPFDVMPRSVRAQPVRLGDWHVPEALDDHLLQGSMVSADGQARLLLYGNDHGQLRIALYPLPGGWESFDPERAVAGHFEQIRQQELERMERDGAQAIRLSSEELVAGRRGWPVAQVLLTAHFADQRQQSRLIMLTGTGRIFVRAFHEPATDDDVATVHDLLRDFMAGLRDGAGTPAPAGR